MTALLIVDIQHDFLPGGALPVPKGDEVIPLIHELHELPFDLIVATKDWHPPGHGSFAANHPGKKPGEHVMLEGIDQVLWPVHCVQGTHGAEFAAAWSVDRVFLKGTDPKIDSYSAFFDNQHLRPTGLGDFLKSHGINDVYITGLATDYCVFYSVLDALHLGFKVHVVTDACRGIDLKRGDVQKALDKMAKAGALLTTVERIDL